MTYYTPPEVKEVAIDAQIRDVVVSNPPFILGDIPTSPGKTRPAVQLIRDLIGQLLPPRFRR